MAFKGWDKTIIINDDGKKAEAIAPVIISASRATDIPAFHAGWFMERLEKGHVRWNNPFNAQKPQYVSFAKTRAVVFWTKNPEPISRYLDRLADRRINFYFNYTLNDYEAEGLEANVPELQARIDTFIRLSDRIGKERVIWRFDPLILTESIHEEDLLRKIEMIGDRLYRHTEKLVISFADIDEYPKVRSNLQRAGIRYRNFTEESLLAIAQGLQKLNERWNLSIATCGEKIELKKYGIEANRCIDDELLRRCFFEDEKLMSFLGWREIDLFTNCEWNKAALKDSRQRAACGCIVSKDIGQYDTCLHLCAYCYANCHPKTIRDNFKRLSKSGENILA